MDSWTMLISEVGFPIVVTLYLLHRLERKLDSVTEAIEKLRQGNEQRSPNKKHIHKRI